MNIQAKHVAAAAKHVGAVLLAWVMATVAAEGLFRVTGDTLTFDLVGMYAPFADGNYRLATNVDTEATWSSGRLSVHTDGLGLRCDMSRRLATRPNEAIDVLLLGDSQGFGNGVNFEESIAGSIAEAAARDGYRVANAAVGGHSAASQLLLARELRERYHLRVAHYVLLATPAMIRSGDRDQLNHAQVGRDGRLYGGTPTQLARARLWAKTNLVIYARVRDALRNIGVGVEPSKEEPFVFNLYESGKAENSVQGSFSNYLSRFLQFAAEGGAQVHIAYIPLTLEMDFDSIRHAAAARGLAIDPDVPLRISSAVAKEHGVQFYSLRPVLEAQHQKGKMLHLRGDFHYDQELSKASGENIWNALKNTVSQLPRANPSR